MTPNPLRETPPTPELDRMLAVKDKSQAIGEFIDWLYDQDIQLGQPHSHANCERDTWGGWACGLSKDEFEGHNEPIEKLLARYFEIDLVKVESERRAILDALRGRSTP